ncbi:MAG: DUF1816 domain-containing protein [Oscillatoriophycideae cyanobacterium NC_groundwater_1537_Pr4_S-0.65um_50_18]|nr:DUF1816 domain-containing protein [Oscillatoriophycideae cyanobacterium NC_groundwater_1537_Pr4_S-0.65um_50_18]
MQHLSSSLVISCPIHPSKQAWWVEVNTSVPLSTYYLGPFESREKARDSRASHVEDLCRKGARDLVALVKQRQPDAFLTDENLFAEYQI